MGMRGHNDTVLLEKTLGLNLSKSMKFEEEKVIEEVDEDLYNINLNPNDLKNDKSSHFKKKNLSTEYFEEAKQLQTDKSADQEFNNLFVTKNPRNGRKTPIKNKLSETFVMGTRNKKDITGIIDKSLNMRSFNFDSDEIKQRRTIKQMAKMYSEIDDLKKQIKKLKSENKILKQDKPSSVVKSQKTSKKQKKIDKILKEAGTSLIDIQKDIDQSLVEISFLKQKNENQEVDNKAEMMKKLNIRKQKLNESKRKRLQNEKVSNSLLGNSPIDTSPIEQIISDAQVNQIISRIKFQRKKFKRIQKQISKTKFKSKN